MPRGNPHRLHDAETGALMHAHRPAVATGRSPRWTRRRRGTRSSRRARRKRPRGVTSSRKDEPHERASTGKSLHYAYRSLRVWSTRRGLVWTSSSPSRLIASAREASPRGLLLVELRGGLPGGRALQDADNLPPAALHRRQRCELAGKDCGTAVDVAAATRRRAAPRPARDVRGRRPTTNAGVCARNVGERDGGFHGQRRQVTPRWRSGATATCT